MGRQAREISSTGYYHVIMRGNNKGMIFNSETNKKDFLIMLKEQEDNDLIEVVAWCIMDNHVHLIVKADIDNLSSAMKCINVRYAMRYNYKNQSVGHVFQGRFKSQPIDTDSYLLLAVRYVHQNPLKAGMTSELAEYRWSSYGEFLSNKLVDKKDSMKLVMNFFNNDVRQFVAFHDQEDSHDTCVEHLEIREDLRKIRWDKANKILQNMLLENDISNIEQIQGNKRVMDRLIEKLIKESGLSLRKISSFVEMPFSRVQRVNKKVGE